MSEGTRRVAAPALVILATVALLGALFAAYANDAIFDSEEFADRATAALDDEAVRSEIATRVTDDLVLRAEADLIGARPVIESVVDGIVGGGLFQDLFATGGKTQDVTVGFARGLQIGDGTANMVDTLESCGHLDFHSPYF